MRFKHTTNLQRQGTKGRSHFASCKDERSRDVRSRFGRRTNMRALLLATSSSHLAPRSRLALNTKARNDTTTITNGNWTRGVTIGCVCVCMCVYLCVCEEEGKREVDQPLSLFLCVCVCLLVCVFFPPCAVWGCWCVGVDLVSSCVAVVFPHKTKANAKSLMFLPSSMLPVSSPLQGVNPRQTVTSSGSGMTFGLFAKYALGGAICCSVTHSLVVPIDVVKTRLQLRPEAYSGMGDGFKKIVAEEGAGALLLGLGPTAAGYFLQGTFKFGFYELFKAMSKNFLGDESFAEHRTAAFLVSAACAEVIADLALCPLEATRIRLVSEPTFANGLVGGFSRIAREEGVAGFYKGLAPILFKQVPYTMAKFAVFERTAEAFYAMVNKPKDEISKGVQLSISLAGGIIAGAVAAVISQPADTVLSVINKNKTEGSVIAQVFRIMGQLGPKKLFLGLGARIAMVASLTAGQFFIYDGIKVMLGLPTTSGK